MKILLLTLIACAASICLSSAQQIKISGLLLDSTASKPVEFATVALLKDGKIIEGATSDSKGRFAFTKIRRASMPFRPH